MSYERCQICGEFGWEGTHICPPVWYVSVEGGPEKQFRGIVAEVAAEKAAAEYDASEWGCAGGGRTIEVEVQGEGGAKSYFRVAGQMNPEYSAYRVSAAEALI